MKTISDKTLLDNLKTESNESYDVLYKFYFPSIASYISQNNGTKEDAEDIFQEAIIVLLGKVRDRDFVLTSSLKAYLFAIARNIWLKKIRDNIFDFKESLDDVQDIEEPFVFELPNVCCHELGI